MTVVEVKKWCRHRPMWYENLSGVVSCPENSNSIPTSLLKDFASPLDPVITKIINLSLSSGNFPMVFKHSLVTPLLKKANLDKENPSSYHPIFNLSFLSKLTERIVLARLNDYLSSNSLLDPHQSGFTKHQSTETLLVSLYNKLHGICRQPSEIIMPLSSRHLRRIRHYPGSKNLGQ